MPELVLFEAVPSPPVRGGRQAIIVEAGHPEGAVIQDADVAAHLLITLHNHLAAARDG